MRKFIIILLIILISTIVLVKFSFAQDNFYDIVKGRILLQVQSHGEAWYVNPINYRKYYLGRPSDAFILMRNLSIGITNLDLAKIPVGVVEYNGQDDDQDGLTNNFEQALGTNPNLADTDNDGFNDLEEINNNYNPLGEGVQNIDLNFVNNNLGKIFLQVESRGQAWYLNPADQKRYYLGRPSDAFIIMRQLSLGITNANINKIAAEKYSGSAVQEPAHLPAPAPAPAAPACPGCQNSGADQIISGAAQAIMNGNKSGALSYFSEDMQKAVEYTMDFLDQDGKFTLGNLISGATLLNSTTGEKTYTAEVYFSLGGYKVKINFHVKKQEDGSWKLTNL